MQNEAVHADYNQHKSAADKALLWRQDIRIMPITSLCYLLCYLDRSEIWAVASNKSDFR